MPLYCLYMSKSVMLSDDACAALLKHKKAGESFSDVVKRLAPPPIRTFGDLERLLERVDGPIFSDMKALQRLKGKKSRSNAD